MASSSASSSTSSSVTLPSSLAFLVSNFYSLVNIKLDSGNYLLWRTQVMNALRANGYIEYLDCTKSSPEPTIVDSSNARVSNPDFTLWTLIDNQLLSCLTSSLSATTLPHVLGLTHTCQVWQILEQRFNSLSKSHIHELKNKLCNVTKTRSMDEYIDEIRGYAQRLEAIGYHMDDDDLVFYALKGLPTEFKGVRSALTAKGDVLFDELATILKNEESQMLRDEGMSTPKVFLATANESHTRESRNSGPQLTQFGVLGPPPQTYQVLPQQQMYQAAQPMVHTGSDYGPYFPISSNRNSGFG